MSEDNPLMVQFQIEELGTLRFYLAPKISDDENWFSIPILFPTHIFTHPTPPNRILSTWLFICME